MKIWTKNLSDKFNSKIGRINMWKYPKESKGYWSYITLGTKVVLLLDLKHSSSGSVSLKETVEVI